MRFVNEINIALDVLKKGGTILYPTDTIWGIGCDATNEKALHQLFVIKDREESKSMIILLADIKEVSTYADEPDPVIVDYLSKTPGPTTVIYENGKNVAPALINKDGTLAIRIVKDPFCTALINSLGKPLVSTSANVSGAPSPLSFKEISAEIKSGVDYVVQHRQDDFKLAKPSAIIRLNEEKTISVIRN